MFRKLKSVLHAVLHTSPALKSTQSTTSGAD
jgi:hypothetical protein